jgi:hypothetical protein
VTKVGNQATVDSALELTLSRLQSTPISQGCPSPASATLNGRTATASIIGCAPTVDSRSRQFTGLVHTSGFSTEGVHAVLPAVGLNEYLVGDSSGVLHGFPFGSTSGWPFSLGGAITAPPLAMLDPSGSSDVSILVPTSNPTLNGGCGGTYCLALLSSDSGSPPAFRCYLATGNVVSAPAQGRSYNDLAYVGDLSGAVHVLAATEDGGCAQPAPSTGDEPVVAGPFVFVGPTIKKAPSDEIYVVTSDASRSELDEYRYMTDRFGTSSITQIASLTLPAASAVGASIDQASLPARVAVTFAGGRVAVVNISTGFNMSLAASRTMATTLSGAPSWCQCPGGPSIAVGGDNGALYLFDPALNSLATLPAGGAAIRTPAQSDGVGDWFVGADDGYLYELQTAGSALAVVGKFGPFSGAVASGVQVGGCAAGLCAYLASDAGTAYIIQLDARNVVMTACISQAPPACSGDNPRVWASVQVGAAGSPSTVHVEGWSYYSP